eukprot:jgi/Chrzof1/2503/Cz11g18020.t1
MCVRREFPVGYYLKHAVPLIQPRRTYVANLGSKVAAGQRSAVLVLPGFLTPSQDYIQLANTLQDLGHPVADILPVKKQDWYPTLYGGSFTWYLDRVAVAVKQLHASHGPVSLVGVSAGGWIPRIALGPHTYDGKVWHLSDLVGVLLTLGTPHKSLEAYPFGRKQEQRQGESADLPKEVRTSSLQFANYHYPDASSCPSTRVVCVVGSVVHGQQMSWQQWLALYRQNKISWSEIGDKYFASMSYQANSGAVAVDGDGVCPVDTALLPGAEHVIMPGVWHTPKQHRLWYGSPDVVRQWDEYLP